MVKVRSVAESLSEIAGGTWLQILATSLLLWLILLPYFAFRQIGERLGKGSLRWMLFVESGRAPTPDQWIKRAMPPLPAGEPT